MAKTRIVSAAASDEDRSVDLALRPRRLSEFIGQTAVKENLSIAIEAARKRGEALDHVLLYGPPGLGKTTLATIIANEMEVRADFTSGPVLQKKLDLTGMLTSMQERQVFFVDEVHRLLADVEEMLYAALEDFRVDLIVGTGPGARMHSIPVARFTAVGATTRQGLISGPLRSRFGITLRINPYDAVDLTRIVFRSAELLRVQIDEEAATEIAQRSRGTPRIANRLLRRVRDYAQVRADGRVDHDVACTALDMLEVDPLGLDEIDRRIMQTILSKYAGGPVGLNTLSASVGEDRSTIEEVYEPYLMQLGFLDRTSRGRVGTENAFEYFNLPSPRGSQPLLDFGRGT
ncbi:MAG: Holliday junction branch migration DNA helicase RuvB [Bryobacterales bacterium]|nr:Holliday junction branch migration DNA helicase RuvB [Bryobacterales bacterium]